MLSAVEGFFPLETKENESNFSSVLLIIILFFLLLLFGWFSFRRNFANKSKIKYFLNSHKSYYNFL